MIPGFSPYSIHDPNYPGRARTVAAQQVYLKTKFNHYKHKSKDVFWLNPLIPDGITRSEMQRLQNHLFSMQTMADTPNNDKGVFLVEDTARFTKSIESLRDFLEEARALTEDSWDILVLGADKFYGTKALSHRCERVSSLRNPYAIYLRRHCIDGIVKMFTESIANGVTPTLDQLYNSAIEHYGFTVIGPWTSDAFVTTLV